ncbi:MAG: SDR family NAD(P)-dependent oxidoreductase [Gammaproteobacteria bacterium]|jgi:NADP-dependent 3-hydroxy acid dehydrogenase YdfG|nr:SDR family NAD(P)-dependent oxidoreductase [Gammaproteobacteria bacterium]
MPSEHDQKLAWVTGGGTGIGKALSLALDREGWQVVISGRTEQKLQAVKELGRSISYRVLDVTDQALHQQVYDDICEELGIPELVVLNAGDYTPMPLEEFDIDLVYRLNRVNYLGVMNGLACILPVMQSKQSGQILLMSSVAGYRGLPDAAPYGATKAALINFAEALHTPLKQQGVLLRVVNPGFVTTPLTAQNDFSMPVEITAEEAADRIISALDNESFEITFPKRFTYILKLLECLPYRLYFVLINKLTGK